jgi:hypothetical protein
LVSTQCTTPAAIYIPTPWGLVDPVLKDLSPLSRFYILHCTSLIPLAFRAFGSRMWTCLTIYRVFSQPASSELSCTVFRCPKSVP